LVLVVVLCCTGATASLPADMVDAKELIPDLVLDMRYATTNNFLKKKLYPVERCLLRRNAAAALSRAADLLRKQGFRIRIWDCYRPHAIQKLMWQAHPVRGYVAPPQPGSVHNRGGAVDVSLADLDGKDVEMPTDFDDFSTRANLHSMNHSKDVMARRKILRDAFEAAGFHGIRSEWWHFEAAGADRFPVLDVPLDAQPAANR